MEEWDKKSHRRVKPWIEKIRALEFKESSAEKIPRVILGNRQGWEAFFIKAAKAKESQDSHLRIIIMIIFIFSPLVLF